MNMRPSPNSQDLAAEAEKRRQQLAETIGNLRTNLVPGNLATEASQFATNEASALWDGVRDAISRHPLAASAVAAGSALAVGRAFAKGSKAKTASIGGESATDYPQVAPKSSSGILGMLHSLSDDSVQLVKDRYRDRIDGMHDAAKMQVKDLTTTVLDAGEKLIAAFVVDLLSGTKNARK